MFGAKVVLLLFALGSIEAVNLRDLAKRIYVGTCLGFSYMNESHVHQMTGQQFNMVTCENEMKWDACEPSQGKYTYGAADAIVAYAKEKNMRVRGHTLIWHGQYPGWLNSLSKEALHAALENRVKNAMGHYKGKIYGWDVVNEVFEWNGQLRTSIWSNHFGESFISDAFKLARQTDPSAKLYINDFGIESINPKSTGLYNMVKKMKAAGVPIDGVGFQSHLGAGQIPTDFEANLKRFTALGVEVALTELDIAIKPPADSAKLQQQAKDYAKVFQVCEAVNKCVGVTVWGFTDKYSWIKNSLACLWDSNFQPKPAVNAVAAVLH